MDKIFILDIDWPDNMNEQEYSAEVEKLKEMKRRQDAYNNSLPFPDNLNAHQKTEPVYVGALKRLQEKYEIEKITPNRRAEEKAEDEELIRQIMKTRGMTDNDINKTEIG